jgi:hypothetical protein
MITCGVLGTLMLEFYSFGGNNFMETFLILTSAGLKFRIRGTAITFLYSAAYFSILSKKIQVKKLEG